MTLKGKTIGISTLETQLHFIARSMLRRHGIDPKKGVKFIGVGRTSARVAALKQGIVDAIIVASPGDLTLKKMGYNILAAAHDYMRFTFSGLAVAKSKIEKERDEVEKVVKAVIKANRYIKDNREGAIEVLMKWVRIDRKMAEHIYGSLAPIIVTDGGLSKKGLRIVVDMSRRRTNLKRDVALTEVADFSILNKVRKELGIKTK